MQVDTGRSKFFSGTFQNRQFYSISRRKSFYFYWYNYLYNCDLRFVVILYSVVQFFTKTNKNVHTNRSVYLINAKQRIESLTEVHEFYIDHKLVTYLI